MEIERRSAQPNGAATDAGRCSSATGEKVDLEAVAGKVAQRQDGLHGREPGAGDEDA